MTAITLVIALLSFSVLLLACVLRASRLSNKRRIEDWHWKTGVACFFVDGAGFVLLLAMGASSALLPFSILFPEIQLLQQLPMLMLLVADTAAVFLLKESAQLRRKRLA